jgi:hypothetical protein
MPEPVRLRLRAFESWSAGNALGDNKGVPGKGSVSAVEGTSASDGAVGAGDERAGKGNKAGCAGGGDGSMGSGARRTTSPGGKAAAAPTTAVAAGGCGLLGGGGPRAGGRGGFALAICGGIWRLLRRPAAAILAI